MSLALKTMSDFEGSATHYGVSDLARERVDSARARQVRFTLDTGLRKAGYSETEASAIADIVSGYVFNRKLPSVQELGRDLTAAGIEDAEELAHALLPGA